MTHQPAGLQGPGCGPPRTPLGPVLSPEVLCHALSCGSGSLIPEFWEAWAEFPEGVSQFSKQIGWLVVTAEPGGPAAREAGGGDWWPEGAQEPPRSLCRAAPPRAAWPRLCRCKANLRLREGKALARGHTAGPGFRFRILDSLSRALSISLTNGQETLPPLHLQILSRTLKPVGRMKRQTSGKQVGKEAGLAGCEAAPEMGPLKRITHSSIL